MKRYDPPKIETGIPNLTVHMQESEEGDYIAFNDHMDAVCELKTDVRREKANCESTQRYCSELEHDVAVLKERLKAAITGSAERQNQLTTALVRIMELERAEELATEARIRAEENESFAKSMAESFGKGRIKRLEEDLDAVRSETASEIEELKARLKDACHSRDMWRKDAEELKSKQA